MNIFGELCEISSIKYNMIKLYENSVAYIAQIKKGN